MQTEIHELILHEDKVQKTAAVIRAVNHHLRQKLLRMIHASGRMQVTEIYKKARIEQSVAWQHLSILRKARVVKVERDGRFMNYRVNYDMLQHLNLHMSRILLKLEE